MTSLSQYDIVPKEVNYIMIDYRVSIDKERGCFVINGPFDIGSIPISIPDDDLTANNLLIYSFTKLISNEESSF